MTESRAGGRVPENLTLVEGKVLRIRVIDNLLVADAQPVSGGGNTDIQFAPEGRSGAHRKCDEQHQERRWESRVVLLRQTHVLLFRQQGGCDLPTRVEHTNMRRRTLIEALRRDAFLAGKRLVTDVGASSHSQLRRLVG